MTPKDKIDIISKSYESLKGICTAAKKQAERDKSFARKIIPYPKKNNKIKSHIINDHFDSLHSKITEHYTIELIATFEEIFFKRIENASGEMAGFLSSEYPKRKKADKPPPLSECTTSFIKTKDDIRNLGAASKIIEKQISKESLAELNEIIEYRNWLCHGKRLGVGKAYLFSFDDIKQRFLTIVEEIG